MSSLALGHASSTGSYSGKHRLRFLGARSQRLVGRSAVGSLYFVGSVREFVQCQAEGSGDAVRHIPRWVRDAALDAADRGGVQVSGVGQRLLGQPDFLSAQADGAAERYLGTLADPHILNPAGRVRR